ncbi:MAG: adenylosuccinate synthetase [Nanoarchaeota archaeon]|nr:adenylosuccinate synthetase [Nanoarchaeota archaeon]
MPVLTIVGALWGDEGKGKVTDAVNEEADLIVKTNGGANAGTTYVVGDKQVILHLLPSGVLRKKRSLLAQNIVMRPELLCKELEEFNWDVDLGIDPRLHVTLPYHLALDYAREKAADIKAKGDNKTSGGAIGTTLSGIGPTYEQQKSRAGIRFCDLCGDETKLKAKVKSNYEYVKGIISQLGLEMVMPDRKIIEGKYIIEDVPLTLEQCEELAVESGKKLKKYMADVSSEVYDAVKAGKKVVLQGAQGTLLDIAFGNYPKVTSSDVRAPAVYTAVGIPAFPMKVVGIVKAYPTKVGSGPVVTCLDCQKWPVDESVSDPVAKLIRGRGKEFGATTGRARRVGWPDMVVLKYSQQLNGFTDIALTRFDLLCDINPLKVCTAYEIDGKTTDKYPGWDLDALARAKPVYTEIEGFPDISNVRKYEDLPSGAKKFVELIEKTTGAPVSIISVGPERNQTIFRDFKAFE